MSATAHFIFLATEPPEDLPSGSGKNVREQKTTFQGVHTRLQNAHPHSGPEDCLCACLLLWSLDGALFPAPEGAFLTSVQAQSKAAPRSIHESLSQASSSLRTRGLSSLGPLSVALVLDCSAQRSPLAHWTTGFFVAQ